MGKTFKDIINRHVLNIATDAPYTFQRRDNLGKSTIDLSGERNNYHSRKHRDKSK